MSDGTPRREGGLVPEVGLCSVCEHARVLENRRGSRFYLCGLAAVDPSFPRYPPLPVVDCRGFSPEGRANPRESG